MGGVAGVGARARDAGRRSALMALRFAWARLRALRRAAPIALAAIPAPSLSASCPTGSHGRAWPMRSLILLALVLGTPVFVAMAALALFFFFRDGAAGDGGTAEVYRLIASPTLPAIPLLTACGYVLAESRRRSACCASSSRCSAGCRAASRSS